MTSWMRRNCKFRQISPSYLGDDKILKKKPSAIYAQHTSCISNQCYIHFLLNSLRVQSMSKQSLVVPAINLPPNRKGNHCGHHQHPSNRVTYEMKSKLTCKISQLSQVNSHYLPFDPNSMVWKKNISVETNLHKESFDLFTTEVWFVKFIFD